jgi:DNA-binding NtrC family response regulator
MGHLLLIQDGGDSLESCFRGDWFDVDRVQWGAFDCDTLRSWGGDLIVAAALRNAEKLVLLMRWIASNPVSSGTLAILPDSSSAETMEHVSKTADDFALWPARYEELLERAKRIVAWYFTTPADEPRKIQEITDLVGSSNAFVKAVNQIPTLARSNRTVLITGETGTGKELCARAIHKLSARHNAPFIPVDCAAFPDHLFENELFGHARGAFTDAHRDQKGLVALAENGTLFLDEVDSLSKSAQGKLLRFLQERTYHPLGADSFVRSNVNVLAATNENLEELTAQGRFRSDLFFRLSVLRIHMPPLRERREDIPLLARHYVNTMSAEKGEVRKFLHPSTIHSLLGLEWPGNVRELYNVVQRAFFAAQGSEIRPEHLQLHGPPRHDGGVDSYAQAKAKALNNFERQYITDALRSCNGNVTHAARLVQKDRRAFGRLIKRHQIDRRDLTELE